MSSLMLNLAGSPPVYGASQRVVKGALGREHYVLARVCSVDADDRVGQDRSTLRASKAATAA